MECLAEDQSLKGDTRRQADNIANKMQEHEFVFLLIMWDEILQKFHRSTQVLQNEVMNLRVCADVYVSLADQLHILKDDFERIETAAKEILPDVEYKVKRIKNLNVRDHFHTTFDTIVDKLESEIRRRGEVYKEIANRFSFLNDIPNEGTSSAETVKYCQCSQKLIDDYPEDLDNNLSSELQQFHSYVRSKFSESKNVKISFSHSELYKIISEDKIECVFPNVDIALRIFCNNGNKLHS